MATTSQHAKVLALRGGARDSEEPRASEAVPRARAVVLVVWLAIGVLACASGSDPGARPTPTARDSLTSGRTTSTGGPSLEQARAEPYDGPKARIAIGEFQTMGGPFAALVRGEGASFGNLGSMLSTLLFQTGRYVVVERQRLDVLLAEQNLAAAGMIRPDTAPPAGEMEGAELLLVGSVTGYDDEVRSKGWWAGAPVAAVGGENRTSRVAMDLRLLDARTGRVLAATSVEGTADHRSFGGGAVIGGGGQSAAQGPMEMAARKALQAAVEWIVSQTPEQYYHR